MPDQTLGVMILKLVLAAVLGMLVGFEREQKRKGAGIRTHMLVAVGAALFTLMSVSGFPEFIGNTSYDPSRIASQIVVGVGFLGAGIIFLYRGEVRGLTTAAGIWVAAGIGMAVGLNFYYLAIFSAILTILIFWLIRELEEKLGTKEDR
jgi:putative Mg2+ transporter-C (MgtC) family protein